MLVLYCGCCSGGGGGVVVHGTTTTSTTHDGSKYEFGESFETPFQQEHERLHSIGTNGIPRIDMSSKGILGCLGESIGVKPVDMKGFRDPNASCGPLEFGACGRTTPVDAHVVTK